MLRCHASPRDTVANQKTGKSYWRIPLGSASEIPQKKTAKNSPVLVEPRAHFCRSEIPPQNFQNNLEMSFSIIYTSTSQGGQISESTGGAHTRHLFSQQTPQQTLSTCREVVCNRGCRRVSPTSGPHGTCKFLLPGRAGVGNF